MEYTTVGFTEEVKKMVIAKGSTESIVITHDQWSYARIFAYASARGQFKPITMGIFSLPAPALQILLEAAFDYVRKHPLTAD